MQSQGEWYVLTISKLIIYEQRCNTMNKDKINDVVNLLVGLQQYEWIRIKNIIDKEFQKKAVKQTLDGEDLKKSLEKEFIL